MNIQAEKIRVIADVHGHSERMEAAAGDASTLLLLGDLVDRGPDNAGVLRLALEWLESGRAFLVRSNHDDKLYRLFKGNRVRMTRELSSTMRQISSAPDFEELKTRFIKVYAETPHVRRFGQYVFAHGAVSRYHFQPPDFPLSPTRLRKKIEHMALYGETDGSSRDEEGRPVRTYSWVDLLPDGLTAIVGHDIRGETPFVHEGTGGSRAIFLDTGCGKGGPLSYMDLPTEDFGQSHA